MAGLRTILWRGARRRCPSCGETPIFERWDLLIEKCPRCACALRSREGDTWLFMYVTAAGVTGVFALGMLFFRPENVRLGRTIMLLAAVAVFVLTQGIRKGVAIAVDYYVDQLIGRS